MNINVPAGNANKSKSIFIIDNLIKNFDKLRDIGNKLYSERKDNLLEHVETLTKMEINHYKSKFYGTIIEILNFVYIYIDLDPGQMNRLIKISMKFDS